MATTTRRRLLSLGAAFALVLSGGAMAFAGQGLGDDDDGEVGAETLSSQVEDAVDGQSDGEGSENATAFSEWVRELPKLGCIRGQMVAHAARGDHRGAFEAPEFGSEEEALDELGLTDRRCAEVALEKAADGDGAELEVEALDADEDDGEGRGKPEHAKGPKEKKAKGSTDDEPDGNED